MCRKKPRPVDAFCLLEFRMGEDPLTFDAPPWVLSLVESQVIRPFFHDTARRWQYTVARRAHGSFCGTVTASAGQWLVQDDEVLDVLSEAQFKAEYECWPTNEDNK